MRPTAARRPLVAGALLVVVLASTLAVGPTVGASNPTSGGRSTAVAHHIGDDARTLATVPVRSAEWFTTSLRSPHADDGLIAVLLAMALQVVVTAWRRAARTSHLVLAAVGARPAASRAPPAFV